MQKERNELKNRKRRKKKVLSCHFHWSRHLFGRDEHPSTKKSPLDARRAPIFVQGKLTGKPKRSAFHENEEFSRVE